MLLFVADLQHEWADRPITTTNQSAFSITSILSPSGSSVALTFPT